MSDLLITCRNQEVIERNYIPAVRQAGWHGGIHVLTAGQMPVEMPTVQGLLLSGGEDIHPRHWNMYEPVHPAARPDPERDALEIFLVHQGWQACMPMLGICRGIQILNVALGGSLIQDIHTHYGCRPERHRCVSAGDPALCHHVQVESGSRMAACLQCTAVPVNSRHHQAVGSVAPGLRPVAWDSRTLKQGRPMIEGVEARDDQRWVLGVQWHPENLVGLDNAAGKAARSLFTSFARALSEEPGH